MDSISSGGSSSIGSSGDGKAKESDGKAKESDTEMATEAQPSRKRSHDREAETTTTKKVRWSTRGFGRDGGDLWRHFMF